MAENDELGHGEVFPGFSCSTEQLFEATSKSPDLVVVLHQKRGAYITLKEYVLAKTGESIEELDQNRKYRS